MGQYHIPVNLTKREFIYPHKLGTGLKVWEQMANHPGTAAALILLLCSPEHRGGGDIAYDEEYYNYQSHKNVVGRWHGDRIALIGDYEKDSDLPDSPDPVSLIYGACRGYEDEEGQEGIEDYTDISELVAAVLEEELRGTFSGDGWRRWTYDGKSDSEQPGVRPDMILSLGPKL